MRKVIAFGISGILLWSCNNPSGHSTTHQDAEIHTEHHHDESTGSLELNQGEKWVVNEEMKPFVSKGSELIDTYIQQGGSDYKALAKQLEDQNNQLVRSCTMDGKSHDELHKWLHPHLEMVRELENQSEAGKADEIVLRLQDSYKTYHEYFN